MTHVEAPSACPRCDFPAPPGATECPRCGIVFAKYAARQVQRDRRGQGAQRPAGAPRTSPTHQPATAPRAPTRRHRARRLRPTVARDLYASLAALADSEAPLVPALEALARSARGPARTALEALGPPLRRGASLADALATAGAWAPGDVATVRAGERLGRVGDALRDLAALADRRVEARRQLGKRLSYPAMLLASWCLLDPVGGLITGGVGTYAGAVATRLAALAAVGAALRWGLPALGRTEPVRRRLAPLVWRAPWPASVPRARARSRFTRVLGRAISSGLGVPEALAAAGEAADAPGSIGRAQAAAVAVEAGATLTEALVAQELLDPTGRLVLTAAEHAGTLDEGLATLADRYEEAADRGEQTLIRVVSGALTLAVLLGVALSVLGVLGDATSGTDELLRQLDREVPLDLHGAGLDHRAPQDMRDLRDLLPRGL